MARFSLNYKPIPEDDQEVFLFDLPKSGSPRRVQGVGFWCPLKHEALREPLPRVSLAQWRSVEALVGTVISPSTQWLLMERGYRLLLQHDSREKIPSLLMDVRHPCGLEITRGYAQYANASRSNL